MASGVNPQAKGMAYGLQELVVYDFDNNLSEMLRKSNNRDAVIEPFLWNDLRLVPEHCFGTAGVQGPVEYE